MFSRTPQSHNNLKRFNILVKVSFTKSNEVWHYELPHELQKDLRPGIFWKKEKLQEPGAGAQSLFQKSKFGTSGQKLRKIRYQSFLMMSNFFDIRFKILSSIVGTKSREMGRKS